MRKIELKGVKQNNLKNIDIEIPLRSFVVICGPSGSGKSSLAFQTLFAEGQRRYLESLSNYAKQFVGRAPKPLLDSAKNIPPSIALEQKNSIKSSRSTVGTHSEVYDYLRTLFAKIGTPFCPDHKTELKKYDPSSASEAVIKELKNKRAYILCPLSWSNKKEAEALKDKVLKLGYIKCAKLGVDSSIESLLDLEFDNLPLKANKHFLVVDRLEINEDSEIRLFDAFSQSFEISKMLSGHSEAQVVTTTKEIRTFKDFLSCNKCDYSFWDLSPDLFSFNNTLGACSTCRGFGNDLVLDPKKIIPNEERSLREGAIVPFEMPSAKQDKKALMKACKDLNIDENTPWKKLTQIQRKKIWEGEGKWFGVEGLFDYLETKKYKMHVRVFISRFKSSRVCKTCSGKRLNPKLDQVKISQKSIGEVSDLPLEELVAWIKNLKLKPHEEKLTKEVFFQICSRLEFLNNIGLHYLSLSRPTKTLSGGEFQRLNISNQLGTELSDTLYVLDEPTIGLHPRDNRNLIELLKSLHANKNTVVVVEHDKEVIEAGEYIFEMGPESGSQGGEVIFRGEIKDFLKSTDSPTANYIRARNNWTPPKTPKLSKTNSIKLKGCKGHNLKNVNLDLPLNTFTCITGVSGSGKSSLITQTLYPAILEKLTGDFQEGALPYSKIELPKEITSVDFINQQRISKSKRSTIATYLGVFDTIRKTFASTPEAKFSGFMPGSFSLNTEGGRCPKCKGLGIEEIDMLFMDNIEIPCDECEGKKYTYEIQKIYFREKNICDVLNLTCKEAKSFFIAEPSITKSLLILEELGLSYLKLGQTLDTLSGGESQRLKLSKYLLLSNLRNKLFIFDEPTTGLHFREVDLLIKVFNKLVDAGSSVVVIEHNLDIMAASDWMIDIGPEAGKDGGKINFSGTPLKITKKAGNLTGKYLKEHVE